MLTRLEIENYGLIARAGVEFAKGATIFTGETGSGKTMLLGALDFALGARAGPDAVRRGARGAMVTISLLPDDSLRMRLEADGFELIPGKKPASFARLAKSGVRACASTDGRRRRDTFAKSAVPLRSSWGSTKRSVSSLRPIIWISSIDSPVKPCSRYAMR